MGSLIRNLFGWLGGLLRIGLGWGFALTASKILTFLGISYLTYSGSMLGVDYFIGLINQNLSLLPLQFSQLFFAAAVDLRLFEAFSIILSAYATRMMIFTSKASFGAAS
jgi:hypothetical protein